MNVIKFDKTSTKCDACVLTCMDFRLHKDYSLDEFLRTQSVFSYDLISVPGAGKALNDINCRAMVLNGIKLSLENHKSKTVFLVHHRDCSAYGGSKSYDDSPEVEFELHTTELKLAKQIIQDELGSYIPIKMIFLDTVADNSDKNIHNIKAITVF